jgi:LytS/YehU family sensor histidine kinase
VCVALGALRGVVQATVRHALAHPAALIGTMIVASAIWIVVPPAIAAALSADRDARWRRRVLAALVLIVIVVEPLWFLGVLARIADWRPTGGYWINGALRLDTNLLLFAALAGWLWLGEMNARRVAAAERASRLRRRASGAELDVLTMQLQPHFLFNTLNLVSQLAFESAPRARRAIANLRSLLAESLGSERGATVTLGDELRFLEAYLDLQRDRFGPRLDARVVAEADLLDGRVPRMLLQPIVENAIRHGIAPRKSGGAVVVRVRRAPGARVSIDVTDDGVGLGAGPVREGLGLTNVRHRLEQLHPGEILLDVSARPSGGASTRLEFPLDARPEPAAIDATDDDTHAASDDVARDGRRDRAGPGAWGGVMVLGWSLVAAIWTELEAVVPMAMGHSVPWAALFAKNFLNAVVWIALTPLSLRLTSLLADRGRAPRYAAHAAGALVFTTAHLVATAGLMRALLHASDADVRAVQNGWAIWDLIAYAMLVAIGETIAARRRLREQRVAAARAAGRIASARVALLRLRLQPALLLSAVDAVEAAIGDPVRCETIITHLGDVLRLLLSSSGGEQVTLRDELALLESYAAVVGIRAAVVVRGDVPLDAAVPAMLLAPLVASAAGSALRVEVGARGDRLSVELCVTGAPLDAEMLSCAEQRLAAIYDGGHALRFSRADAQTTVSLDIPLLLAPDPARMRILEQRAIA